jgi:glycosyltransferase involved in cell wall biosynthesis
MVPQLGRDSLLYMIADRWLFAFGIPFALLWYFSRGRDKTPSSVMVMVRTLTGVQHTEPAAAESGKSLRERVLPVNPVRVVLWQNMLSHLQSSHVRALAETPGVDVTIVGLGEITAERKALGWSVPEFGNARTVSSPEMEEIEGLIREGGPDCVHLMAGWRGLRLGRELLETLRSRKARIGLLSEGADNRGAAGIARRLVYVREREAGAKFDFILAMGSQGRDWFRSCGYPEETIFPYAYIVEKPLNQEARLAPTEKFEITFIGQLIRRKGLDIALRALKELPDSGWRLTVVGDGKDAGELRKLTETLALTSQVRFLSALPSSEALDHLLYSDLLVLPSRFDGWGAVVNEALMRGVRVVSSDRCGAKDLLLGSAGRGEVFAAGSVFGLARALERRMAEGKQTQDRTDAIRRWSKSIEGESGAQYVLDVIRHVYEAGPRPTPIWDHASLDHTRA